MNVAIIPARAGSKGLPGKNSLPFAGSTLVGIAVTQALALGLKALVTTDDPKVSGLAYDLGATVIDRPFELAQDQSPTEPAILHAMTEYKRDWAKTDVVVLLQPTSPLRRDHDVLCGIDLVKAGAGSATSVTMDYRVRGMDRVPRQKSLTVAENGAVYAMNAVVFLQQETRLCAVNRRFLMPDWTRHEVDDEDDFLICEMLYKRHMHVA